MRHFSQRIASPLRTARILGDGGKFLNNRLKRNDYFVNIYTKGWLKL